MCARPRLERESGMSRVAVVFAVENARAALRIDEAPVARDAQRHDLEAVLRRRLGHRARGENRDFVFGGTAAEEENDSHQRPSGMDPNRYFKSSSFQRIPPPKMNAVSLSALSTPLVTK